MLSYRPSGWSIGAILICLILVGPFVALLYKASGDSGGLWGHLMSDEQEHFESRISATTRREHSPGDAQTVLNRREDSYSAGGLAR